MVYICCNFSEPFYIAIFIGTTYNNFYSTILIDNECEEVTTIS